MQDIDPRLLLKGEVRAVVGGPPCQGHSGLNRNNDTKAAELKNSQIEVFFGFVDFFRPEHVIMENVTGFLHTNEGAFLRNSLIALNAMGYQARAYVAQVRLHSHAHSIRC